MDRVDILALEEGAAGADDTDDRKGAGALAEGDVADRVLEPVVEQGEAEMRPLRRPPFDPDLRTLHPLRLQEGIVRGGVRAQPKRAVELVERRQPPADISSPSQGEARQRRPGEAAAPGRLPAGA